MPHSITCPFCREVFLKEDLLTHDCECRCALIDGVAATTHAEVVASVMVRLENVRKRLAECQGKNRGGHSITCPVCLRTSYHPLDIANKYCANCHAFWSDSHLMDVEIEAFLQQRWAGVLRQLIVEKLNERAEVSIREAERKRKLSGLQTSSSSGQRSDRHTTQGPDCLEQRDIPKNAQAGAAQEKKRNSKNDNSP